MTCYGRNTSLWWDNRSSKVNPTYPDFKHKVTKESLRIEGLYNSSWVVEELRKRGLTSSLQDVASSSQHDMQNENVFLDRSHPCTDESTAFITLLRSCAKHKDLHKGSRLHDDILKRGLLEKCSDALVIMYAKCGALVKAKELLDMHKSKDIFSWTALIAGYARQGQSQDAMKCFEQMQHEGLSPDAVTFACILKACGNMKALDKGKQIHDVISRQGLLGNDIVLGSALVDMYAKCGALQKAQCVLEELPIRNVVSWSALIAGYAQQGQGEQALNCFERMQHEGLSPDSVTFASILKACGTIGAVRKGEQIHDEIARQGLLATNVVLGAALVDMYAKCGALAKARQVLEELPSRNIVSWNSLIAGYAHHGLDEQALNCFKQMQLEGLSPDAVTFACILKACASIKAVDKGEEIHNVITRQGLLSTNVVLGTALVDMYAKCGALTKAQKLLEQLPFRNIVSWNSLITGYAQQGQGEQALTCFEQMQAEGLSPNSVTFACALKACGTIAAVDKGEQIHDEIARQGLLGKDTVLGTALVDMYAKCGALEKAQQVLDHLSSRNVVSWNVLLAGYAQQNRGEHALNCFEQMQREGISPDAVTFACILKVCAALGAFDKGEQIHDEIAKQGLLGNDIVLGSALVDMYAKCGALVKAQQVLEELPARSVVSWNALITGYAQQGQGEQALNCFKRMQHEGFLPDAVTFSCVLNACSHLGLVEEGHNLFINMSTKYGVKPNLEHYTCMVDLFGRAGHLDKAVRVIQEIPPSVDRSAVWSALLGACQKWGDVNVGRWAFDQAVQIDESDGGAYVLMANIYTAAGMQEDAENIEVMRKKIKMREARAYLGD